MYHKCIIENHMMYGSWDMECDRFFLTLTVFCPFTPLTTWKIIILIKWKKQLERLSFYTCVPSMKIICFPRYEAWQTEIFVDLGPFCPFTPITNPENQNFEKMK